ncbi:MAG: phospho-N-acetylmuramoyl-pentapeptide-transferase [Clostridia bacterium]|nr:phospho-N-acetylmuramoyl-pentapeptide-transferase [Clostridia bacterium]
MTVTLQFGLLTVFTFAVTVLILRKLIPVLKSRKMGQKILEIGPRWHKKKEGTPTMGGLAFIAASTAASLLLFILAAFFGTLKDLIPFACALLFGVLNGAIGIIDDRAKLLHKQNEGLKAWQKYLFQLAAAAIYLSVLTLSGRLVTALPIPGTGITVELGWLYYPVAIILLTGFVNSVNLTDGIDGLASSVTAVVGIFYALAAFFTASAGATGTSLAMVSALMLGSTLGFLVYNWYPARVFMGDTGSLFLGGLVIGGAFVLGNPLIVVICGIVYVCETLSVMLQVGYFKLTKGKRLFKMAPIHHHFEKSGWSEICIVAVFSAVTAVFCALAWVCL